MPKLSATRMLTWQRGAPVTISVNETPIVAHEGEMLAAALLAAGILNLRCSPNSGTARGAFCLMGVCQECLVRIEGRLRQACLVTVSAGLVMELLPPYAVAPEVTP